MADAWSRTYRSRAVPFAASADAVSTRNGVRIFPDRVAETWPVNELIPSIAGRPAAPALDDTLRAIEGRYGVRTANMVAMQLEYSR